MTLSVRPEDMWLSTSAPEQPALEGRVVFVRDLGRTVETFVRVGELELTVLGATPLAEGTRVWLEPNPEACVVLGA